MIISRLINPLRSWKYRLLVTGGLALGSYASYRSLRDRYYNFPIDLGAFPITTPNFIETKSYKNLQEKLKQDYKKQTNYLVLIGDSGTGKTIALGQVYSDTTSWFRGGLFGLNTRPWIKLWVSIPHDATFSNSELIVRQHLLMMAEKIHQETWAVINKKRWKSLLANWLLEKLPVILQPNFVLNFIQDNEEQTLKRLKHYLETHPGWLIALDNLQTTQGITDILPSKGGTIVITTNNNQLTSNPKSIVDFDLLDIDDSQALIKKNLSMKNLSEKDAYHLAVSMGRLPLGIVQACGYINSAKISISEYLNLLNSTPLDILAHDDGIIAKHPNLVRSLHLMLERIQEVPAKANTTSRIYSYLFGSSLTLEKRLLFIMSLLESQEVPARLLQEAFFNITKNQDMTAFHNAAKTLTQFNVIERQEKGDYFKLHPLKQRILQAMIRPSALDEPYWPSWDILKYYFSRDLSLLDAVLKAFTQVKTISDNTLNSLMLLKHAIYVENLLKNASSKRYNKKEYNGFVMFKLELLSRLFSKDSTTKTKKECNLELLPHVEKALLSAASKSSCDSDAQIYILDLSIKRAFLKLMTGQGKEGYAKFSELYEKCRKQANISDVDIPKETYKKLSAKSEKLPILYIALLYGLGRSYFYLARVEQDLLLEKQEKHFKECIELCDEVTNQTGKNIVYHYLAKRSGLWIMKTDRDDKIALSEIINEYEKNVNDNKFYIDDEGKQYHFANDAFNKIDSYDRIIRLNLRLIKLYPPDEIEEKRQACFTIALHAANNMLAELKKAESEDNPIERSSKYYNTVGEFWLDAENPNRNLNKATSYFRQAAAFEEKKGKKRDFPLGDAYYGMAKIYQEKQQWVDASQYINSSVDIYRDINHRSLQEAEKLQQDINNNMKKQELYEDNLLRVLI